MRGAAQRTLGQVAVHLEAGGAPGIEAAAAPTAAAAAGAAVAEGADDTSAPIVTALDPRDTQRWHGAAFQQGGCVSPEVLASLQLPKQVANSSEANRPGYDSRASHEYFDTPQTLNLKLQVLANMLQGNAKKGTTVVYSGAGLSTSSGIGDYASRAGNSRAPHKSQAAGSQNRLALEPTKGHYALSLLGRKEYVHHWVQQNHDRLAQKAGYPQERLNEIHGAWGDMKNPVVAMNDGLRPDLLRWLEWWEEKLEQDGGICLVVGSSLCGMNADRICVAAADVDPDTGEKRGSANDPGGLVIIGLQATALDDIAAVRIWGLLDDVLTRLVVKAMKLTKAVPDANTKRLGAEWVSKHPQCRFDTAPVRRMQ